MNQATAGPECWTGLPLGCRRQASSRRVYAAVEDGDDDAAPVVRRIFLHHVKRADLLFRHGVAKGNDR